MAREYYFGKVNGFAFDRFIGTFELETYASSEAEARRNFGFQIKKRMNLVPGAKIKVEGTIQKKGSQ